MKRIFLVIIMLLALFTCAPAGDYEVVWVLNDNTDPNYAETYSYILFIEELNAPEEAVYIEGMAYSESISGYVGEFLHADFSTDSAKVTYTSTENGKYLHALLFANSLEGLKSTGSTSNILHKDDLREPQKVIYVEMNKK